VIVLGIDPGTAITGYGVVCSDSGRVPHLEGGFAKSADGAPRLMECGVIRTSPRAPLASRLQDIFDGVTELIDRHHPDALAVEDVFYARNVRTTVVLGHARGVVLLAGARAGVAIHEYAPALIKKTVVGRGAATKEQVQFMVARLLRLKTAPQPADAADGVACALTCIMSAGTAKLHLRIAG
jgi:crossover junction endodeoxyribonuclease RuvC